MSDSELQAAVVDIEDETEKGYVTTLQGKRVKEKRKKDLETMSAIGDPESVLYDPAFAEKSAYQSTAVTDGSLGESDTGYADIDYEFINGNENISELIVGMEKNYHYITDQEKQIYNYWHNYDLEHGTTVAKNYLDLLQETLNDRDSEKDYSKIEGDALLEVLYGIKSGLSKFGNDVNNWYLKPEGYIPATSTEMTAQRAHDGLADEWDFIKINGQSLAQHGFNIAENFGYNLPGNIVGGLAGQGSKVAGAVVKGIFSGVSANGDAYRQMIQQGYTPEQAKEYGNRVGIGTGVVETTSNLLQNQAQKRIEATISSGPARALGKILTNNDWLGITESLQSIVEDNALKTVTGEDKPDEADLQAAAQSAVTAKAVDKIFNQMKANPEDLSLDLRQSLLQSLKDPNVRKKLEETGSMTNAQAESLIAGLESAGDEDEGMGTYVGDILYGPTGFAINKQELIPLAEEAFRNRGAYADDPNARALYEMYKGYR